MNLLCCLLQMLPSCFIVFSQWTQIFSFYLLIYLFLNETAQSLGYAPLVLVVGDVIILQCEADLSRTHLSLQQRTSHTDVTPPTHTHSSYGKLLKGQIYLVVDFHPEKFKLNVFVFFFFKNLHNISLNVLSNCSVGEELRTF